ncbi:MAG: alpha/beta hydrolase, partial [Alphaproteobacteria bacterium]
MAYLTLRDGLPVHVRDEGGGRPIVLLQGLMLSADYFWQHNRALAKSHRLITYDQRGHGLTGKPLSGYSIRQCADDLHEILELLDVDDVTLGGVAFGAMVMLEYLRAHGTERLAKLVVIEAQVRLTNAPDWPHPSFGDFPAAAGQAFVAACRQSRAPLSGFLDGIFAAPPPPEVMARMQAECWLTPTGAVIDYLNDMLAADYRADIARIPLPTLFIYGRRGNKILPTE